MSTGPVRSIARALACVATVTVAASAVSAEIIDRVLAIVGGELIMLSDVNAARDFGLVTPEGGTDPVRAVLTKLIDRQLILAEVERYAPPEPSAEAVDSVVRSVRSRFASQQAFEVAVARSGMDDSHLRATVREDLRIREYLQQRFTVPQPADDDIDRYYREHLPMFTRGGIVTPFAEARSEIVAFLTNERRQALVDDWLAGLRRRAEIIDLYQPGR